MEPVGRRDGRAPVLRLHHLVDYADDRVERAIGLGRKGALAAYRDATVFKVIYSWGHRYASTTALYTGVSGDFMNTMMRKALDRGE